MHIIHYDAHSVRIIAAYIIAISVLSVCCNAIHVLEFMNLKGEGAVHCVCRYQQHMRMLDR